jgi:pimeloyl-ACP methyl ester carboxylesterase
MIWNGAMHVFEPSGARTPRAPVRQVTGRPQAVMLMCLLFGLFRPNTGFTLEMTSMVSRVAVDDIEIAYRVFGEDRGSVPLVMIMGYGGLMEMWPISIIESLAQTRRVIVFDNRGMGYSSSTDKDYSIALFAEDTYRFLQALSINSADVLGWSMGSFIAQELALRHPEKVGKLILLSASCGGPEAIWPDDTVWRRLVDISGTLDERVQRMMENLFPPRWLRETPDPLKVFPPITAPVDDQHILRQANTLRDWPGTYGRLPQIAAETLLLTGTDDIVIPAQNASIIARRIENSSVRRIENGGHGFFYQYPEVTAAHILSFQGAGERR